MAADFDNLIDELERSYTEVQARMSDPSVYNDRREAADVGRKLKELEGPYKLAQEWRAARAPPQGARARIELHRLVSDYEQRGPDPQKEVAPAMVPPHPPDPHDVIPQGRHG